MMNKYPGNCAMCGHIVGAGEGIAFKNGTSRKGWSVQHSEGGCENASTGSYKKKYGTCEDAPCCGCCGQGNEYMSEQDYLDAEYNNY